MANKKKSAIVAASLGFVLGLYGSMQTSGKTKIVETRTPDQGEITTVPIVLDTLCISIENNLIDGLSELKTLRGDDFFTCDEKLAFKESDGTLEYAKELASLKDLNGKQFFTGYDLVAFKQVSGTVDYAKKFVSTLNSDSRPFSGSQLPQFYKLGLDVKDVVDFTDTLKPDALIIYPAHDGDLQPGSRNFGAFRTDYALDFYNELKKSYDIKVNVVSVEEEVYDALEASKGFMFFMAVGHGTKKTLSLGEKDLRTMKAEKDERYVLDISDSELEHYLQNLDPQATIFLNSCSTGEGGMGADNLANAVAGWANGRQVIAAQDVLASNRITNVNPYPFDVILLDEAGEKEITYRISLVP